MDSSISSVFWVWDVPAKRSHPLGACCSHGNRAAAPQGRPGLTSPRRGPLINQCVNYSRGTDRSGNPGMVCGRFDVPGEFAGSLERSSLDSRGASQRWSPSWAGAALGGCHCRDSHDTQSAAEKLQRAPRVSTLLSKSHSCLFSVASPRGSSTQL